MGDQGDSEGMGELVNYSALIKTFTFSSDMPLTHFFKLPPFTLFYYAIISASRFNLGLPILSRSLCILPRKRRYVKAVNGQIGRSTRGADGRLSIAYGTFSEVYLYVGKPNCLSTSPPVSPSP